MNKKSFIRGKDSPGYRRHLQGVYLRGGASVILWFFALSAYLLRIIDLYSYAGISFSVGKEDSMKGIPAVLNSTACSGTAKKDKDRS